jgi:protease-4
LGVLSTIAGYTLPSSSVVDWLRRRRFGRRPVLRIDLEQVSSARSGAPGAFFAVADVIEQAGRDPILGLVVLRIAQTRSGFGGLQCLRAAIHRARESGTVVVAHLVSATNADLYVASACDQVFCTPGVESAAWGVRAQMTFFGDALRRLGLGVDVVAVGDFKSLGETFARSHASASARDALQDVVTDLHGQWAEGLATSRGLAREQVEALAAQGPLSAAELVESGWVDAVGHADAVEKWLEEELGGELHWLDMRGYLRWWRWRQGRERFQCAGNRVVVLHCTGAVVMNARGQRGPVIAGDELGPRLDGLAEDGAVRAVVLALSSGGGSALASELIAHSVERLKAEKPVVSVLGDVAASGGYYIPVGATELYAQPGTLTGSIGVIGGKLVIGPALARAGIHSATVSGSPHSDPLNASQPFTDGERMRIRRSMERVYELFLDRVQAGRNQSRDVVLPWAGGRVWTGKMALEMGMIDGYGTISDGFRRACALAGVTPTTARRSDQSLYKPPFWRRIAQKTRTESMDTAAATLRELSPAFCTPAALTEWRLLTSYPGTALALFPWHLDLD